MEKKGVCGPILYFPGEGSLRHLFILFFYIEQGFDRLAGSAPEARKGIGSPAGAASTRPLGDIPGLSNAYSEGYGTEQLEVK